MKRGLKLDFSLYSLWFITKSCTVSEKIINFLIKFRCNDSLHRPMPTKIDG